MAKAKKAKPVARSHHKKPTSARMLKNRPLDPPEPPEQHEQEQPEQAAGEAEELETPSTPKPKPRQARLPGTEDPEIEELESAAEEYADIRDQRMELTKEEVRLQSGLLAAMKKYNKTSYVHDGYDLKLVAEKEKVRVRIKKDE